jgi:hypothetical protein
VQEDATASTQLAPATVPGAGSKSGAIDSYAPPMTVRGSTTNEHIPEDLGSGDLIDLEENTGADMKAPAILEETHAREHVDGDGEDEIVIADDLAEIVDHESHKQLPPDDDEERTDAGSPLPRIPET